jgi:hypothetical protein
MRQVKIWWCLELNRNCLVDMQWKEQLHHRRPLLPSFPRKKATGKQCYWSPQDSSVKCQAVIATCAALR